MLSCSQGCEKGLKPQVDIHPMTPTFPRYQLLPFILNAIAGSWCLRIMGDEPSAPDLRDLKPFAAVSGFFHSDRHVWKGPPPSYMQMWMQSFSFPIDGVASRASHRNPS